MIILNQASLFTKIDTLATNKNLNPNVFEGVSIATLNLPTPIADKTAITHRIAILNVTCQLDYNTIPYHGIHINLS